MPRKIIVIGSSNMDFVMKMSHLPQTGETVSGARFVQAFGGKGANQAVAASKAGGEVWFVNCVGDDNLGAQVRENLRLSGVHVDYMLKEKDAATGTALIMVNDAGENYISVAPGANHRLTPRYIQALKPALREAALVILQNEILPETSYEAIDLVHSLGKLALFNLAPAQNFDESRLSKITYLVVNETEAQSLCGFAVDTDLNVERAAGALLARGVQSVIITLGKRGSYIASANLRERIPAYSVRSLDTTAAGDIFCGALAATLVEGRSLSEAAHFANAASAISVTRLGAQPSIPARAEIENFIQTYVPGA